MAEEPEWLKESDQEYACRVAKREGRIASVPRDSDKESIRHQLELIDPLLNKMEKAARAVRKMKAGNISQVVPGVLDDLKEAVDAAAEREKILQIAVQHGWSVVRKYETLTSSNSDPMLEKAIAAHMAESSGEKKKRWGVRKPHRRSGASATFPNPASTMTPNFGGYSAAAAPFPAVPYAANPYPVAGTFPGPQWPGSTFSPLPQSKGQMICFRCGGCGHKAPECPNNKRSSDK